MRHRISRCIAVLAITLCTATAALAQDLTVSAAISLKEALGEAAQSYEKRTGAHIGLTFASTGQLMAQVRAGAPVDVFIAATERDVERLEADGLILPGSRRIIASNELVLITPAAAGPPPTRLQDLAENRYRRIAIGHPRTVPAGQYATQALSRAGLEEALAARLVYGANVRQVLDYVVRGEADAGIVYRTDAVSAGQAVTAIAIDPALCDPIRYAAGVCAGSSNRAAAERLLEFLVGPDAQAIFARHGFAAAAPPATQPSGSESR
jgi:molybdate transport system substrate-binding protein